MQPSRNLIKGLDDGELQIIGVEFTVISYRGRQELAMFSPNGLIIPRLRSAPDGGHGDLYRPNITFHTTDGDYTIGQYDGNCPW